MARERVGELVPGFRDALGALSSARSSTLRGFISLAETEAVRAEFELSGRTSGELSGVALAVKDNIHVAGMPNTAATLGLQGFVPTADAPTVARLRARGMVVIGKTNMHELALGVTSAHSAGGAVENAVSPGRVAGGSSGGTAAVIGAGVCSHGLGTDTGGSARIPAAFNDVWGFRPSTGRYDGDGITSIAYTRDTVGAMADSLRAISALDAALSVVAGTTARKEGALRIGVDARDLELCDSSVGSAFATTLSLLQASPDFELVPLSFESVDARVARVEPLLGAHELIPSLGEYLRSHSAAPTLHQVLEHVADPHVSELFEASAASIKAGVWTEQWHDLMTESARVRAAFVKLFLENRISAVLRPTAPIVPPFTHESMRLNVREREAQFGEITSFARLATVVGAPSLSIPLGQLLGAHTTGALLEGLPGCDLELLAWGEQVEATLRQA